jgi:hypothetical protein
MEHEYLWRKAVKKLIVICEGRSEANLVKNLLSPVYSNRFIIIPKTLPTGKNPEGGDSKGGWRKPGGYTHGLREIKKIVNLHKNDIITTFFDLYGFPEDIPCFEQAQKIYDPLEKAKEYETQLREDIVAFEKNVQFFPHIQPYELEALLFVDPEKASREMSETVEDIERIKSEMTAVRREFKTPEHINGGAKTAPSKRLETIITNYRKNKAGRSGFSWRVATEIGILKICEECLHFGSWIKKIENL